MSWILLKSVVPTNPYFSMIIEPLGILVVLNTYYTSTASSVLCKWSCVFVIVIIVVLVIFSFFLSLSVTLHIRDAEENSPKPKCTRPKRKKRTHHGNDRNGSEYQGVITAKPKSKREKLSGGKEAGEVPSMPFFHSPTDLQKLLLDEAADCMIRHFQSLILSDAYNSLRALVTL